MQMSNSENTPMLEVSNIAVPLSVFSPNAKLDALRRAVAAALGVSAKRIAEVELLKRSVDARRKSDVHFVCTVAVRFADVALLEEFLGEETRDAVACGGPVDVAARAGSTSAAACGGFASTSARGCSADTEGRSAAANKRVANKRVVSECSVATQASSKTSSPVRTRTAIQAGVQLKCHIPYEPLHIPACISPQQPEDRPLIVGAGPAGLFAALYLARAGLQPILVERGPAVDDRIAAVDAFVQTGVLNENANIQFGEGGAGTFSDGKLNTNTKSGYTAHVLHWFTSAGAPEEILWQAKPHIGTDLLVSVVRSMRQQILEAGGEVRFCTKLEQLQFTGGQLVAAQLRDVNTGARETIPVRRCVLACGHSARDTFTMLRDAGVPLERKPFSVGVRIEHPQVLINRAQYGSAADHPALGAADYKLSVHLPSGRGVYTFCMCPGGEVVCAASEEGGTVVNGMSRYARNGVNANSALLVSVNPEDFEGDDVLAGMSFQREIERAAYRAGMVGSMEASAATRMANSADVASEANSADAATDVARPAGTADMLFVADAADAATQAYVAPAQTGGDFLANTTGNASTSVVPSYPRGVVWANLRDCLPTFVTDSIAQALPLLDRRLRGFANEDAVMTGVETRSSSPVRIVRGEEYQTLLASTEAAGIPSGLYPCGEGAGYAGGITSAAADGLRVAEALVRSLQC